MTSFGKCPEFSAFLSHSTATLETQTPIKREGRLLDKAPTVGLIHWEEPFGSLRSWCGAEVLGIIGQLGPVNCPECLRLRSENSGV